MSHRDWTRRELLKWGLGTVATTAALESLGNILHVPGWHHLLGGSHLPNPQWSMMDSYEITRMLGQRGAAAQLATLLQLQQSAQAQSANDDWVLITVKVFDEVHQPLVFAFGEIDPNDPLKGQNKLGQVKTANDADAEHFAIFKATQATREHLSANGIKSLAKDERLAKLRFNEWFASRLLNGTYDGKPGRNAGNAFSYVSSGNPSEPYVNTFPSDVAIQVGLCVQPMGNIPVHRLHLAKMRTDLCDLSHFAALKGLVNSPLGITCMMMGENYDSNGSMLQNVVMSGLTTADNDKFEVGGRSLKDIVKNVNQSLAEGFVDERKISEANLTYLFDKISVKDPVRRKNLLEAKANVKASLDQMLKLGDIERTAHVPLDEALSNKQAFFANGAYTEGAAQQEFLSHCAYVAESLKIPNQPYRNFSLFLNLNDLDGSNIDNPTNGSTKFKANSLNYVDGMRQLAMGLNMLANAIKGKKALVVMVTDGGRSKAMGDGDGAAFAMVLGPKGPGMLDDALHAPENVLSSNDRDMIHALGSTKKGLSWTTGSQVGDSGAAWGLCENDGRRVSGVDCNMGDWQVGALHFLGEKQGRSVVAPELGRFVKLKKTTS